MFSEDRKTVSTLFSGNTDDYEVKLNISEGFKVSECQCAFFQDNPGIHCKHLVALALWVGNEGMIRIEADDLIRKSLTKEKTKKNDRRSI